MWLDLTTLRDVLSSRPASGIVVIGSGGTAGAAAAWIVDQGVRQVPVTMVGAPPTIAVRTPSNFELRLLSNEADWDGLSLDQRQAFVQRIATGFLWPAISRRLEDCRDFTYVAGNALRFVRTTAGLELLVGTGRGTLQLPAARFIDCRGYDEHWFTRLFRGPEYDVWKAGLGSTREPVDRSMRLLPPFPHPGIHVPSLGWSVGPAANNLLSLGWLSDRLVKDYTQGP